MSDTVAPGAKRTAGLYTLDAALPGMVTIASVNDRGDVISMTSMTREYYDWLVARGQLVKAEQLLLEFSRPISLVKAG